MTRIYDCSDSAELLTGMRRARAALAAGELVVIPTDTVYGVAADAFEPAAVHRLLAAKRRDQSVPSPVLVPDLATLDALAAEVPDPVRVLVREFWPGALTVILRAQPSLRWDLGDTRGTVAVRMPANQIALELLAETGPLAVSSANLSGEPAATTAAEAERMLGNSVTVYLDAGTGGTVASTVVDATSTDGALTVVRSGALSRDDIAAVLPDVVVLPEPTAAGGATP